MKKYFLMLTFLLFGCSAKIENEGESLLELINNRWMLVSLEDEIIADLSSPIYFKIEKDSTIKGFAGCNEFWGGVTLTHNEISFSKIAATRMYCERMDVESKFLSLLQNKISWIIDADSLYFYNENKLTLKFVKLFLE